MRIAEQSLQMARALSDRHTEAFGLSILGYSTMFQGNMREGARFLEQSLALYRVFGDKIGQATTMEWLSLAHLDLDRTITIARESLELNRELGNLSGIASSLTSLARVAIWSGDLSSPVRWLEEALSISRQIGDQISEATVLISFGTLAYWLSDYRQANLHYEEVIRLSEKTGDHFNNLWAHTFMAYAILRQGNIQQARQIFVDSIGHSQKRGITIGLVFAVEGLASLEVNQKEPERAAWLFAWADTMRERMADSRPPIEQASVDRDIAVIRSQLDEPTFENACKTGRAMMQEQVIETLLLEIRC
jgi:tetratricopeptide (TPR) repeat protein